MAIWLFLWQFFGDFDQYLVTLAYDIRILFDGTMVLGFFYHFIIVSSKMIKILKKKIETSSKSQFRWPNINIWRLEYQSYEAFRMLEGSECPLTTQKCRVKIHNKLIFLPILSLLFSFLLGFLLILIFPSSPWWSSICPTIWAELGTGHVGVNPTSHLRYPSIKSRLIWLKLKKELQIRHNFLQTLYDLNLAKWKLHHQW